MLLMSNLLLIKSLATIIVLLLILFVFSMVAVELQWTNFKIPWDKILIASWVILLITVFFSLLFTIWFIF